MAAAQLDEGVVERDPTASQAEEGVNLLVLHQCEPALDVQALLRMRNIPHRVINRGDTWDMGTGTLPQLLHGSNVAGAPRIDWKVARTSNDILTRQANGTPVGKVAGSLDAELSAQDLAISTAFSALLDSTLADVTLFCRYAVDDVFAQITEPALLAQGTWPMNRYTAWARRRSVLAHLAEVGMTDVHWVRLRAEEAYAALAQQLTKATDTEEEEGGARSRRSAGLKRFAFGDTPSTLDAKLFGHLAAIQGTPAWLWASKHRPLKALYRRIAETWFMQVVDLSAFLDVPQDGVHAFAVQGVNRFTQLHPPAGALRSPTLPPTTDKQVGKSTTRLTANHRAKAEGAAEAHHVAGWWWARTGTWNSAAVGVAAVGAVAILGGLVLGSTRGVSPAPPTAVAAATILSAAKAVPSGPAPTARGIMMPSTLGLQ